MKREQIIVPAWRNSDAPEAASSRQTLVMRCDASGLSQCEPDVLAQEVPVALAFNDISHATLLASPSDLEDFAYGFSYTEGIIRGPEDIYEINVSSQPVGIVLNVRIASACMQQLKLRRRNMAGRTGCGLCGVESLDAVERELMPVPGQSARYDARALSAAVTQLRERQPLHQATGATHAAGWAALDGHIDAVREDVGRHNALDKLIGARLRQGLSFSEGFAAISSRASFEMVQKSAAAGIGALIAVSAPTAYAVDLADRLNLLLAGFARGDRYTVYSHAEYLHDGSPA